MSTIDYASVKREDLEMKREPRKAQITVVHLPTGTVASDPVVPGSLTPARFRRPTNLPKENRLKGMEGYIEGQEEDTKTFFPIYTGENPKNEYLDALANDPEALKASFEGTKGKAAPPTTPETPEETIAAAAPAADAEPPAEQAPAEPEEMAELDDILAELDTA